MPSTQVINFGEDPYANAIGGFAKNFLTEINEGTAKRRNEEIFSKIKSKYGPDANPENIFKDVLEAENLDQDYKRNKLDEIKNYAELSTKANRTRYDEAMLEIRQKDLKLKEDKVNNPQEKPLTAYQKKNLDLQETRLELDRKRLKQAADTQDKKLPEYIDKYTTNLLKGTDETLPAHDKADLNGLIEQLMTDSKLGVNEAFNTAYDAIQERRQLVEEAQITPRPSKWIGSSSPQEVNASMDKAFQELKQLHDEAGVTNQSELRKIAKRAGWNPEEITAMLQKVFNQAGKSLRGSPGKQKSAEIPFQEQGIASQVSGIDDILFGE